jgi:hypothetical protein
LLVFKRDKKGEFIKTPVSYLILIILIASMLSVGGFLKRKITLLQIFKLKVGRYTGIFSQYVGDVNQ